MKKTEWRQLIEDIYHQELEQKLRRMRKHFHPFEKHDYLYLQRQLFSATKTIRMIEDVNNDDYNITQIYQPDYLRSVLQEIRNANQSVNERLLIDSGIIEVFEEHISEIVSELEVSDLPVEDIDALKESGSIHPRAELRLRIRTIKKQYITVGRYNNDRRSLSSSIRKAGEEVSERIERLKEHDEKSPPRKRWFKGLGSLCRGTVLTAVDISLLGGWWTVPLSPDTTIVGAVASIATGLGDIAVGIGEFRDE